MMAFICSCRTIRSACGIQMLPSSQSHSSDSSITSPADNTRTESSRSSDPRHIPHSCQQKTARKVQPPAGHTSRIPQPPERQTACCTSAHTLPTKPPCSNSRNPSGCVSVRSPSPHLSTNRTTTQFRAPGAPNPYPRTQNALQARRTLPARCEHAERVTPATRTPVPGVRIPPTRRPEKEFLGPSVQEKNSFAPQHEEFRPFYHASR